MKAVEEERRLAMTNLKKRLGKGTYATVVVAALVLGITTVAVATRSTPSDQEVEESNRQSREDTHQQIEELESDPVLPESKSEVSEALEGDLEQTETPEGDLEQTEAPEGDLGRATEDGATEDRATEDGATEDREALEAQLAQEAEKPTLVESGLVLCEALPNILDSGGSYNFCIQNHGESGFVQRAHFGDTAEPVLVVISDSGKSAPVILPIQIDNDALVQLQSANSSVNYQLQTDTPGHYLIVDQQTGQGYEFEVDVSLLPVDLQG